MKEINNIDDLRNLLRQEWLLDGSNIEKKFQDLASILLHNVVILKGNKKYKLTDIEFYFYCPTHQDIITYPRNSKAGEWFFHSSGVDLSFESNVPMREKASTGKLVPCLTSDSAFGGILIRGIKHIGCFSDHQEEKYKLNGPMKVCEELFDKFDAFDNPDDFPRIILEKHNATSHIKSNHRVNLKSASKTTKDKVASILANNYCSNDSGSTQDELVIEFNKYLTANYRFTI
ncbi:hypothetical protein [Segatella copri]|uniref:hypothetical protein n=1 Tax=Segatella copri TaxID=165179 RepID=UPI0025FBF796|nr:hypothetical protein [Segatella copri]MDV3106376.1 hypothetical protein [Segatella copri]MDV3114676.1 hypothetical protein [Segatella copri]WOF87311.1 hypothetical protein RJT05_14395 [Segatella copri]WOF93539.1 hypothetical protein RJT10_13910 [Segatella copri]